MVGKSGAMAASTADQHILIFIYDIDGDYTSTQSSGMVGYFWAKDEYLDASVAPTYRSNQAELFYLDAYFADLDADLSTSTLAHEYQHMIQFNQKKLLRGVEASTWFDEMCSMASEDFVGQTLGIPDSASPRSRIPQFNIFLLPGRRHGMAYRHQCPQELRVAVCFWRLPLPEFWRSWPLPQSRRFIPG